MSHTANIVEVFSSIQGEGKYIGCRQVFVRLAGCNACCAFCDTPASRNSLSYGLIESSAGRRDFVQKANPLSTADLVKFINNLLITPHHSISITGGEPLCQADVIADLAGYVGNRIYLETNGTLPSELEKVLPFVDIISMDIKLPSATGQSYWTEHREFLRTAARREVFVKIVLTGLTTDEEFKQAISLVAEAGNNIPVILQPVTPVEGCTGIEPARVLILQERAMEFIKDVRVIPQTHKLMGQL